MIPIDANSVYWRPRATVKMFFPRLSGLPTGFFRLLSALDQSFVCSATSATIRTGSSSPSGLTRPTVRPGLYYTDVSPHSSRRQVVPRMWSAHQRANADGNGATALVSEP